MKVRGEALELAFRIVLSCPCDVTHEQERQVFAYLRGLAPDEEADYARASLTSITPISSFKVTTRRSAAAAMPPSGVPTTSEPVGSTSCMPAGRASS